LDGQHQRTILTSALMRAEWAFKMWQIILSLHQSSSNALVEWEAQENPNHQGIIILERKNQPYSSCLGSTALQLM